MAHSNPEFALGLMRPERGPVRFQRPDVSFRALQRRMLHIAATPAHERHPDDAEALRTYKAGRALVRAQEARRAQVRDAHNLGGGGMHGSDPAGCKFVEPKRRVPLDVQRDKVPGSW